MFLNTMPDISEQHHAEKLCKRYPVDVSLGKEVDRGRDQICSKNWRAPQCKIPMSRIGIIRTYFFNIGPQTEKSQNDDWNNSLKNVKSPKRSKIAKQQNPEKSTNKECHSSPECQLSHENISLPEKGGPSKEQNVKNGHQIWEGHSYWVQESKK